MRISALLIFLFAINTFAQNGLIKTTYSNGNTESEINYMNNVRDGEAKFYWENGKIKTELTYNNGKVDGLVKEYYPSGILKESYTIQDGKKDGPHTFYNEQGAFVNEHYFTAGKRIIEENSASEETASSETYDSTAAKDTLIAKTNKPDTLARVTELTKEAPQSIADTLLLYGTKAEVMPEPLGGWVWLYKKLSYPKEAREKGITGTSYILAYINEKGTVVDAKIESGFDKVCDEAARNAVTYTRFKPALLGGHEVKIKMVIPVVFSLP